MRVYGVDFTSRPSRRHPIVCSVCELESTRLTVRSIRGFNDFAAFERLLRSPGPWLAGLDFPFSMPACFVSRMGWPACWSGYVGEAASLGRSGFASLVRADLAQRPPGAKYQYRAIDRMARAASPMNITRPPVGLMFIEGAPRLLASPACVQPCRLNASNRIVFETYPALAARKLIGSAPYKRAAGRAQANDTGVKSAAADRARRSLVQALQNGAIFEHYGLHLELGRTHLCRMRSDCAGDVLDSVLCAIQAAWASLQPKLGIPAGIDSQEGWVVDPDIRQA